MALTANIVLVVPTLPDADIWFANAAAWTNYWRNITAEANFDGADTTIYVPVPYDTALEPAHLNMDGVEYDLVTIQMFQSLQSRYDALEASYEDLRTQLKDAGLITNAQ